MKPNTKQLGLAVCVLMVFSGCESKPLPSRYYNNGTDADKKMSQSTSRHPVMAAPDSHAAQIQTESTVALDNPLFATEFKIGPLCETCLGIIPNNISEAKLVHNPNPDEESKLSPTELSARIESLRAKIDLAAQPRSYVLPNFFGEDDLD
jgi:hypothetical protein